MECGCVARARNVPSMECRVSLLMSYTPFPQVTWLKRVSWDVCQMALMATRVRTFSRGVKRDPTRFGVWALVAVRFTIRARKERPILAWSDTTMKIVLKSLPLVISKRTKSCFIPTSLFNGGHAFPISTRLLIKSNTTESGFLVVSHVKVVDWAVGWVVSEWWSYCVDMADMDCWLREKDWVGSK